MNQTLLIGQQLLCTHVEGHVIKMLATRRNLHAFSYTLQQSQGHNNVYMLHGVTSVRCCRFVTSPFFSFCCRLILQFITKSVPLFLKSEYMVNACNPLIRESSHVDMFPMFSEVFSVECVLEIWVISVIVVPVMSGNRMFQAARTFWGPLFAPIAWTTGVPIVVVKFRDV